MGLKPVEVRSWEIKYRGDILICASQKPDTSNAALYAANRYLNHLQRAEAKQNQGKALCVVNLIESNPMAPADEVFALYPFKYGLWAHELNNVRPLEPFAVRGRLGIWTYYGDCHQCQQKPTCGPSNSCSRWYPADSLFFFDENQPLNQRTDEQGEGVGE